MKVANQTIVGRGWFFPPQIGPHGGLQLTDEPNEIQQAIRIILTTIPGERVMRPTFGSRLHELVFAPVNPETMMLARRFVEEALKMWEPRIRLVTVDVRPSHEPSALLIEVEYEISSSHDRRTLVYPLYLIPEE